jgi:hypothetical protein
MRDEPSLGGVFVGDGEGFRSGFAMLIACAQLDCGALHDPAEKAAAKGASVASAETKAAEADCDTQGADDSRAGYARRQRIAPLHLPA